ncbi:MAG: leucine-rich repeat domain-containing protein [Clostridia bacterium]|nr:leucine-rich repeat domain-containing protein [Clostridia bacterium]
MKKMLSLVLSLFLSLSVVGCGDGDGHQHDYTVKKMEDAYLAAEQSCMVGRLYFYACSVCGRSSGEETDPDLQFIWQGSDALGHDLTLTGCTRQGCGWVSTDSGTLSSGMQWAYYPDGTLYFFGSGALPDWSEEDMRSGNIPWMSYAVRTVVLPKGVSTIGDRSFAGLSSLRSVTIPWGVTSVGESAFDGCKNLSVLELPDSLNVIGADAFRSCSSLTSIALPRYAVSLDGNVFAGCTSLSSVTVASGNTAYRVQDGCLIEIATGTLVAALPGSTVPADGSITIIGASAFEGRTDLSAIHIPASVTSIGEKAFYGCTGVTGITVDATSQSFTAKGNCLIERSTKRLIQGCSMSEIPADGSVTEIGDYAFADCAGLTSIHIPNTVSSIAGSAFSGCSGLETITAAAGNEHYHAVDNCLIVSGTRTLLLGCKNSVIPDDSSVIRIGNNAFAGSSITSLIIPDDVTEIGEAAFEDCVLLEELIVGCGITTAASLNAEAFSGCSALNKISVAEGHPTFAAEFGCLIDTSTRTLLLGTNKSYGRNAEKEVLNITSIGAYAFAGRALDAFFVPKTVTSIGEGAFYGCSNFSTVSYEGSEEEWAKIALGNAWATFTLYTGTPNTNS